MPVKERHQPGLTRREAEFHARGVRQYWRDRGHNNVECVAVMEDKGTGHGVWSVRSNLVNGSPPLATAKPSRKYGEAFT